MKSLCQSSDISTVDQITVDSPHFMTVVNNIMTCMVTEYVTCWKDMNGRSPGKTCRESIYFIKQTRKHPWNTLPYNAKGGGCGGSMRAMSIGLRFMNHLDLLIAIAIESGRLTHNHSVGFMGALLSALFTSFAIKKINPKLWGYLFMNQILPKCKYYLKEISKRDWKVISEDLKSFEDKFIKYLKERGIAEFSENAALKGNSNSSELDNHAMQFPSKYGVKERDAFYKSYSHSGWAGSSGDDSIIVAYDALLSSIEFSKKNSSSIYEQVLLRGALHGGDSDTTGAISMSWYGALYGFKTEEQALKQFKLHYEHVEKRKELLHYSTCLYSVSCSKGY
ncbi:hypothetical protein C9374_006740 [Naegleria lovaniensis]|uniref:ADP-ribosylhydrolase ARH1 n=1 Tax=Naegleria lovaniensis TaxID=51637 RepID=A0AA88GJC0_NAELO|nr:uncharacterized protein C9374_006740 [Naegleria lovaniensis]KAG2379623.1 hypothetical protein C9374_006740 [Naegleria lovaniensis]